MTSTIVNVARKDYVFLLELPLATTIKPVYIISDSRLTEFGSYIRTENINHLPIPVEAQRGARLNRLGTMTANRLRNTPGAAVIVVGGINNCTTKNTQTGKYKFTL